MSIKQRILTFIPEIEKELRSIGKNDKLELETRFYLYTTNLSFSRQNFFRIIRNLQDKFQLITVPDDYDSYIVGEYRNIVRRGQSVWQKKEKKFQDEIGNYGLKIVLSRESSTSPPLNQETEKVRRIKRYTYVLGELVQLDLSEVSLLDPKTEKVKSIKYEIEVELLGGLLLANKNGGERDLSALLLQYSNYIDTVFRIVHDTHRPYSKNQYTALFRTFNQALGFSGSGFERDLGSVLGPGDERDPNLPPIQDVRMHPDALYRPRDLKYRDLVQDGILRGDIQITFKTDGYRKAVIINSLGLWLLYKNSVDWILGADELTEYNLHNLTILDAELIPLGKRRGNFAGYDKLYYVLVFDALVVEDIDVRSQTLTERIGAAAKFALNKKSILIELKQFWSPPEPVLSIPSPGVPTGSNAPDFFSLMSRLENVEKEKLRYKDDGYILVSGKMPYNSGVDRCDPRDRNLTRRPDMCKWKPLEKLTIDFSVQIESIQAENYLVRLFVGAGSTSGGGRGGLTEFPHSGLVTIPRKRAGRDITINNGEIYEFNYVDGNFSLVQSRPDRPRPNGYQEAISVWENIQDPISIETLTGNSVKLMRKYHNRIKRSLYQKASLPGTAVPGTVKADTKEVGKFLLDIGAGEGGTISSWDDYAKVIAVEPDQKHIGALIKRLNKAGKKWIMLTPESLPQVETILGLGTQLGAKILIAAAGGEQSLFLEACTERFFGRQADVVAAMFSLTFFWQSPEMLGSLKLTLDKCLVPDGRFIFAVLDGNSLNNIFQPPLPEHSRLIDDLISNNLYEIRYSGPFKGNPLEILIRGTVVTGSVPPTSDEGEAAVSPEGSGEEAVAQTEYVTYIEELFWQGFENINVQRFDQERMLNNYESYLSRLYIYGDASFFGRIMTEEEEQEFVELEREIETARRELPPIEETAEDTEGEEEQNITESEEENTSAEESIESEPLASGGEPIVTTTGKKNEREELGLPKLKSITKKKATLASEPIRITEIRTEPVVVSQELVPLIVQYPNQPDKVSIFSLPSNAPLQRGTAETTGDKEQTQTQDIVRISNTNHRRSSLYGALLKSFYSEYAAGDELERRRLAKEMQRQYSSAYLPLLSYDLDLNIMLARLYTDRLQLTDWAHAPSTKKRPFVVLGVLKYNDVDYYEVLGLPDPKKKVYRTIFPGTEPLITNLSVQNLPLIRGSQSWKLIIGNDVDVSTEIKGRLTFVEPDALPIRESVRKNLYYQRLSTIRENISKKTLRGLEKTFGSPDLEEELQELVDTEGNENAEGTGSDENYLIQISLSGNDQANLVHEMRTIPDTEVEEIYSEEEQERYESDGTIVFATIDYQVNYRLLLAEIYVALASVTEDGVIFIKLGDIDSNFLASIIYLLTWVAENSGIVKPSAAKPYQTFNRYLRLQGIDGEKSANLREIIIGLDKKMQKDNLVPNTLFADFDGLYLHLIDYISQTLDSSEYEALSRERS